MPTFAEASKLIGARVAPLGVERVSLLDAAGRVIDEDVVAPWDMPLFDSNDAAGIAAFIEATYLVR